MSATTASLLFMAPYALVGWLIGPFAGRIAPRYGYKRMLQVGLLSSAVVLIALVLFGLSNPWVFGILVLLLGVTHAGITNDMLNGLGTLLSPASTPGLLPGLNGASFGIGAGLSFTVLGQAITSGSAVGATSTAGYVNAIWLGVGIVGLAFLVTFLLPKPQVLKD